MFLLCFAIHSIYIIIDILSDDGNIPNSFGGLSARRNYFLNLLETISSVH